MARYIVCRYSKFPKQYGKDLRMLETPSMQEAINYAIKLNNQYNTRYCWRALEEYEK